MAKLISTETVYKGWSTLYRATIALEDGTRLVREVEDHGAAVAVLPYDPERRTALLVRQMRAGAMMAGVDARPLEAPAGLIDPGESAEEAARREALEETGVRLDFLETVGTTLPMPGISTETITLFLSPYDLEARISAGGGLEAEHENIEVVEAPLRMLAEAADTGELPDLKTLALVLRLRLRRPDLFG